MRNDFRMMKDVAVHTRVSPHNRVRELEAFTTKANRNEETSKVKKKKKTTFILQLLTKLFFRY